MYSDVRLFYLVGFRAKPRGHIPEYCQEAAKLTPVPRPVDNENSSLSITGPYSLNTKIYVLSTLPKSDPSLSMGQTTRDPLRIERDSDERQATDVDVSVVLTVLHAHLSVVLPLCFDV